jgi:phenylalanyl-tRNA synthetase beta chain
MQVNRRLYRCSHDRRLAGVASGLAEFFDLDVSLVRILWILSVFVGGLGILLYIVMAIIVPLEPLSAEAAALRTVIYASLLEPARRNADAGEDDVALFEIARVYRDVRAELPEEHWHVAGIADGGFTEAKWAVEQIYSALGIEPGYDRTSEPFLHPGKAARTGEGWLGELHPALLEGVWGAFELDLDALAEAAPQVVAFAEVSPYPEVRQDLAFVVDEDVPAAEILAAIREAAGGLLRELAVFDEYRNPETIGEGKRSLAFRLAFGSPERTLTDEDVAPVRASIVDALATRFDAVLRA